MFKEELEFEIPEDMQSSFGNAHTFCSGDSVNKVKLC